MNSAIELDDQFLFSAVEICHVEFRMIRCSSKYKRMLSQKFKSTKLSVAQMLPNDFLFWCLVSSKFPANLDNRLVERHWSEYMPQDPMAPFLGQPGFPDNLLLQDCFSPEVLLRVSLRYTCLNTSSEPASRWCMGPLRYFRKPPERLANTL